MKNHTNLFWFIWFIIIIPLGNTLTLHVIRHSKFVIEIKITATTIYSLKNVSIKK